MYCGGGGSTRSLFALGSLFRRWRLDWWWGGGAESLRKGLFLISPKAAAVARCARQRPHDARGWSDVFPHLPSPTRMGVVGRHLSPTSGDPRPDFGDRIQQKEPVDLPSRKKLKLTGTTIISVVKFIFNLAKLFTNRKPYDLIH